MDRSLVRWPEPHLLVNADRGSGLVLVQTAYTIAAEKEQQFLQAMALLRQSRLRTGAIDWALYQDGQNPPLFIELFGVPSWDEHLRQHRDRQTGTDLQYHDDAAALSDPRRKPITTSARERTYSSLWMAVTSQRSSPLAYRIRRMRNGRDPASSHVP